MTVAELIAKLGEFDPGASVAVSRRVGDDDEMYEVVTEARLVENLLLRPVGVSASFVELE